MWENEYKRNEKLVESMNCSCNSRWMVREENALNWYYGSVLIIADKGTRS